MVRLHMVVEGQTEEEFVNSVLVEHLGRFQIVTDVRCVETSRRGAIIHRGGTTDYSKAKKDLRLWMKEDYRPDVYFTTMFDLYALPDDFPSFTEAKKCRGPYQRVEQLENAFAKDIEHRRFIPYIQLHEFEALLLADPAKFKFWFVEYADQVNNLVQMCQKFDSPELINDGEYTAPSKRIIKEIPPYAGAKVSAGPAIAQRIGLAVIRLKCPHFNKWLSQLESLQ